MMKIKNYLRALAVIIATFVSFSANAQSIEGCWDYETKIEGHSVGIRMLIDKSRQAILLTAAEIPNDDVGVVTIALISAPTAVKTPDDKLIIEPDPKKVTLKVTEVEWSDKIKVAIEDDPSIDKTMTEEIEKSLQENCAEMAKDMMFSGEFTIVDITQTELVLKDEDGEQMTFVKSDPDSGQ